MAPVARARGQGNRPGMAAARWVPAARRWATAAVPRLPALPKLAGELHQVRQLAEQDFSLKTAICRVRRPSPALPLCSGLSARTVWSGRGQHPGRCPGPAWPAASLPARPGASTETALQQPGAQGPAGACQLLRAAAPTCRRLALRRRLPAVACRHVLHQLRQGLAPHPVHSRRGVLLPANALREPWARRAGSSSPTAPTSSHHTCASGSAQTPPGASVQALAGSAPPSCSRPCVMLCRSSTCGSARAASHTCQGLEGHAGHGTRPAPAPARPSPWTGSPPWRPAAGCAGPSRPRRTAGTRGQGWDQAAAASAGARALPAGPPSRLRGPAAAQPAAAGWPAPPCTAFARITAPQCASATGAPPTHLLMPAATSSLAAEQMAATTCRPGVLAQQGLRRRGSSKAGLQHTRWQARWAGTGTGSRSACSAQGPVVPGRPVRAALPAQPAAAYPISTTAASAQLPPHVPRAQSSTCRCSRVRPAASLCSCSGPGWPVPAAAWWARGCASALPRNR